jgi:hypothetical protein
VEDYTATASPPDATLLSDTYDILIKPWELSHDRDETAVPLSSDSSTIMIFETCSRLSLLYAVVYPYLALFKKGLGCGIHYG